MLFKKNKNYYFQKYLKQIILGLTVFLICKNLPDNEIKMNELFIISISISVIYHILDRIAPSQKIYI